MWLALSPRSSSEDNRMALRLVDCWFQAGGMGALRDPIRGLAHVPLMFFLSGNTGYADVVNQFLNVTLFVLFEVREKLVHGHSFLRGRKSESKTFCTALVGVAFVAVDCLLVEAAGAFVFLV